MGAGTWPAPGPRAWRADAAPVPCEATDVGGLLRRVVGDDLVGVWLHGSAVAGGLRPDSDVDVLAVVARPLDDARRAALVAGLLEVSGRYPRRDAAARPVELAVVVRDDVLPWRYPPVCDLLYGEWLREGCEAGDLPRRGVDADLAVLLTVVRAHGVPVVGPGAVTVLDRVPGADLRRAVLDGVGALLDDLRGDERNVLLTLARVVVTVRTGWIVPKDEAAATVADDLPADSAAVLRRARAAYLGIAADEPVGPDALVAATAERLVALAHDADRAAPPPSRPVPVVPRVP
ncbi:aminoglycoside adenylyltransferase family protein [Cellulomonas fimi]|uniref:3''-adenylyltransferase n=1 Tax=Cellulomonas fimi (strain ATCC 484 / DSM 20113 / JCM 1341 / CCUG 24087 / LMG 16345 / NBRC 15513 / NCIMB 8980 / NCTC 7547 / NRS-133) TaxID=590998 RepID=F4H2J2_CELFA|nr:aminoglycoside adenylyltransferase family protein [Cellulomonas fimi]AEE45218.1 3''-adenylyltransferase [Cellulomonas fimi ATCC 484]VEH28609.1 Streptomycin 3''-adenylyltransferase [Cellulomonas fimi]